MSIDFGSFLDASHRRLDAARRGDGYARTEGASEADLYGTAAAVGIRAALGSTPRGRERHALAGAVRAFQDTDGRFRDLTHGVMHRTATGTATLRLLGEPSTPPGFLADLFQAEAVAPFLDRLDWGNPWLASHDVAGLLAIGIATGAEDPGWLAAYVDWLDVNADPETGLWRRGGMGRLDEFPGLFGNLGGAFHMHFLLDALPHRWPHATAVVDTGMALLLDTTIVRPGPASPLSAWGFPQLDWVYSVGRAAGRTGHRHGQVRAAIVELARDASEAFDQPQATAGDLHVVQARVALVAELSAQLGSELETGGRMLRPVTDARPFI